MDCYDLSSQEIKRKGEERKKWGESFRKCRVELVEISNSRNKCRSILMDWKMETTGLGRKKETTGKMETTPRG